MTSRLNNVFERLRRQQRAGLITYITAGDPTPSATVDRVRQLIRCGVDVVELGIPFSDPLADGPVNVRSAERALRAGTRFADVLQIVRSIRRESDVPIVLYSYLNPLLPRSFLTAVREIAEAGADGLLVLDLTIEEAGPYLPDLDRAGLAPIFLVTPTSTDRRMKRIAQVAQGFVYCVSRTGVTGERSSLSDDARDVLQRMRRHTHLPLALGFGISSPDHVRLAAQWADAVVVGSALVDRLHRTEGEELARNEVWRWVQALAEAAHSTRPAHHGANTRH